MSETNPASDGYKCVLCGGAHFGLRHEWPVGDYWNQCTIPIRIWDCQDCDLTFLWPVPKAHEYPGGGDWHSPERKVLRRKSWLKTWRRKLKDKYRGTHQERLMRSCLKAKSSGRFLDVGCGMGVLLELASQHFEECVGIEVSERAAEVVRQKGFRVHQGLFEDVPLEPDYYDMVVLDSVIEHVFDPVQALKICYRTLKPGGVVCLMTPKLGGWASTLYGRGWNGFRHGWHTFLFSGKTLGACMKAAGFTVMNHPRRDRPFDDLLILWGKKPG